MVEPVRVEGREIHPGGAFRAGAAIDDLIAPAVEAVPSPFADRVTGTPARRTAARSEPYPIEGGIPHPHWIREPTERALASVPIVILETRLVTVIVTVAFVGAFLAGLIAFWPVTALPK